jgi:cysteine desulfurase
MQLKVTSARKGTRFYFDFNATSPLSKLVLSWLSEGDFLFANPSSSYEEGQDSRRLIEETTEFIQDAFSTEHEVLYHSGATEGINLAIKGFALKLKEKAEFFFFSTDHKAVLENKSFLQELGHKVTILPVLPSGDPDQKGILNHLLNSDHKLKFLNWTWANNETGCLWPLSFLQELRSKVDVTIHVDAVQTIGKFEDAFSLAPEVDFYTFSGHKFGAMKGIGFSLVKEKERFLPLFQGGSQQGGFRPGTMNPMGIYSLKLALQEAQTADIGMARKATKGIQEALTQRFPDLQFHSFLGSQSLSQTISLSIPGHLSDILLASFDQNGVSLSKGSACSSGASTASHVLQAMGVQEEGLKGALRLSFSAFIDSEEAKLYYKALEKVLERFS